MVRPIRILLLGTLILAGWVAPLGAQASGEGAAPVKRSATAQSYMISAANPHAVEAGLAMLDRGGSAVDAAIAAQAVLGLVEPQSSGIGGGGFLLHFDPAADRVQAFDGRETAPAGMDPRLFLTDDGTPMPYMDAALGGAAVGVPGNIAMLERAHEAHGNLPWADLFQPAIALATEGFKVSPRLHQQLSRWLGYVRRTELDIEKLGRAVDYFFDETGEPVAVGTLLKNPAYAATLTRIAEAGAKGFYEGPVAEAMVETVRNAAIRPGSLSLDDLADYEPTVREPVCGPYRDSRVCSMGPPSSGATTVLGILGLLEGFDMAAAGPGSAKAVHLFAEASRLAYADRGRYLADTDFVDVPVEGLIDPAYLAKRRRLIDPVAAMPGEAVVPGDPPSEHALNRGDHVGREIPATSHMTIVDAQGRVVSFTTTVQIAFGSMLMVEGFLLNNELTDFSFRLEDGEGRPIANRPEPGKRPRSSMSPVIAFDAEGRFKLAVGSPGGGSIISYVAKSLVGLLDWDMTMQEAIASPNMVHRGRRLAVEPALDHLLPKLTEMGHTDATTREMTSGLHGIRAVRADDGTLRHYEGGADPRREGIARGQ